MILEHFKLLKDNRSQKKINLLVVPQAQQSKQLQ